MHPRNVRRVENTHFSADSGSQNRGLLPWKAGALRARGVAVRAKDRARGAMRTVGVLARAPRSLTDPLSTGAGSWLLVFWMPTSRGTKQSGRDRSVEHQQDGVPRTAPVRCQARARRPHL
jgi:hypothetical protein